MGHKIKKTLIVISILSVILASISLSSSFFLYNDIYSNKNDGDLIPLLSITANKTFGKSPLKIHFESSAIDYDGKIISHLWNFDDGEISYDKNPNHIYSEKGKFIASLTIEDNKGGVKVDHIEINVIDNNPPIAHIDATTVVGRSPLNVEFQGSSEDTDGRIISYHWEFDDTSILQNSTSSNQNTSHTFIRAGIYIVNLTTTDNDGAVDSDLIKIEVKPNLLTLIYRMYFYLRWIWNKILDLINFFIDSI